MIVVIVNCHLSIIQLSYSYPETQGKLLILLKYMTYFQGSNYFCCLRPGSQDCRHPGLSIVNIRV